jgi:hypothetical protein
MSTKGATKEVTSTLLWRKKIWIVGVEKILGFPSSLFLRMTAPLNLIESDHPSPHDSVLLTQKLHWMLWIGQVGIKRHDIINNDIGGRLHTFLQLRYVEYVVHPCQKWRQLQSVCHSSQFSQDRKQTDVAWCKLAFDPESLHTSRRRDTKVHMVASFKLRRSDSSTHGRQLSCQALAAFRLDWMRLTISPASVTRSEPKIILSPGSIQFRGVRY